MKINKIYISAFGGLKDFSLELTDGLNVIYGNNEDGKSTVAAFIKAMFYGTGRSNKNLADSPRQKYTPWDGSVMAGRIYFEDKGKKYCLEREFRKSDSTDRIMLTDLDSGKQINVGENIGQEFLGISSVAFERSLFIGNGDFIKDDTAASEINGKLSNIAVTGTEDISYKKIQKNIFDARAKLISKSGRTGSYNDDLQALADLESRLTKADDDAKTKSRLNDIAAEKRDEYESLYKKYTELKSIIDRERDFENREKLIEFLQTKKRLDELNDSLKLSDGTIINETFTQKVSFCLGKYNKCQERCDQITADINRIKETIELQNASSPEKAQEQIDRLSKDVERLSTQKLQYESDESAIFAKTEELKQKLNAAQNKKAPVNLIVLLPAILLAASGGAAAYFISPIIAAILCSVAAVLLALSFIIKPKNTSAITSVQNELAEANTLLADTKADKNRAQEEINNINARINTLTSVLHADAAVKQQRLADMREKNELLNTETQKADAAKAELMNLLSGFNDVDNIDKIEVFFDELIKKTEQQKILKLELKTASQFLGNIDYADAQAKLDAIDDGSSFKSINFGETKSEFEAVTEKLSALKDELTVIATELKTSFKNSENPEELKRKICDLQEKADSKKAFCDAADLAIAVLEESFYELRRGYGSELETLTHSIFAELTDGRYKSVNVTDSLDMSVEQTDVFGTRDLDYLSLGTTHQAYLSLRLAIAKLISKDDTLPLFLDDSLSQYDDTRATRAMQFLKEFCINGQGILFTCHNSICEIAKSLGVEIQKPYK